MKRASLALTILTTALLVLAVACGGDQSPEPEPPCIPGEPACPDLAGLDAPEALARMYAPVLYLREQDTPCDRKGNAYDPIPVDVVLDNPEVALRGAGGSLITMAPTSADLFDAPSDAYLDLPGNPRRPGCGYEQDYRRMAAGTPPTAYASIIPSPDSGELSLQYWFFYYFNDWNNKHEGDWERIQLTFEATSAEEALTTAPVRIGLSGHRGGEIGLWEDEKVGKEGTRPVVYVAAGSQANFFGPHIYVGRAESNAGLGCDDASPPHRRVAVEVELLPLSVDSASDPYAWLAFEGRWGQVAGREFSGPTGPAAKDQWQDPTGWEEGLRNSTLRVPSRDLLGPSGVDAFCATVAFVTHLFVPVLLELPIVVGVVAVVILIGALYSLTHTRYLPIEARPLRKRRRIGQILVSAAEVYRRRARTFLAIGLLFIPTTFLIAGVQWLVLNVSPVDPIVPVPTSNVWQEIAIAFALAELEFGIVYAIVLAASTVALTGYDAGTHIGAVESYRRVGQGLHRLALPRLMAIVVVSALAFTIIGIPLALWLAVRWTFIDQAVLMEGKGATDAMRESAAAVSADWRWSAAATLSLLGVGLFAAPAFGIVLILAYTSLPLLYVNLLTSAVYMALVPYVAIALAMVYYDLKSR